MNHDGIEDALLKIKKLNELQKSFELAMQRVRNAKTESIKEFQYIEHGNRGLRLSKKRFEDICFQIERICRDEELDIIKKYEDLISKI